MENVDDTCNKDSDGDVLMKDDEVSLNIINKLFLPICVVLWCTKKKE